MYVCIHINYSPNVCTDNENREKRIDKWENQLDCQRSRREERLGGGGACHRSNKRIEIQTAGLDT